MPVRCAVYARIYFLGVNVFYKHLICVNETHAIQL